VNDCVFCAIVKGEAPAQIVHEWSDALAIVPLGPVVEGHLLVIPKQHVADVGENPAVSAGAAAYAAELASGLPAVNVITSKGRAATQSVAHLHWHIVPRAEDDGLALPWYSGKRSKGRRHE
jgi:histidine triad (HIT) family protein